ncbi:phosphoglycolate phosphatase [Holospora obtusa F1]|uniref:phosphoglycolate phosphatase n=1 Tax=Holospora obtusa F1 TaxID=1399147 RepID=W6TTK8_HOLOB|nr:HAD family hydrolase [Holospora obtusa]ETZ07122.1 phosphoglycolate phosphatase [Holospora obtusa F1]
MSIFKKVEAVFFDWDGTLVDTVMSGLAVMNNFLSYKGKEMIEKDSYVVSPSLSVRDAFLSLFSPEEYREAVQEFKLFLDQQREVVVPFKKSSCLLEFLYKKGVPVGIVSNQYGDVLRRQVKKLKWQSYFSYVSGSGDWEQDKPSALPLIQTLKQVGISPGKYVLFVGDSLVDMMCAQNAGCTPVSVGTQAKTFDGNFVSFENIAHFYAEIKKSIENNFLGENK